MKSKFLVLLLLFIGVSCASKKDILYLQDATENSSTQISYQNATIQPNDILKIEIESIIPEAAIPYNKGGLNSVPPNNVQMLQLDGYLVSNKGDINFPILGSIIISNLTTMEAEEKIKKLLVDGGHLNNPTVNLRLVNAKVTILGEVNVPGTYNFTEQNISLLQALGYAGDLTINGKREDIIITREVNGERKIAHIDITNTNFMNNEYYFIKPNDVIIVNPNQPKVTSSGYIGDLTTLLALGSVVLSSIILLSR